MSKREDYQYHLEELLSSWQADLVHLKEMAAAAQGKIHPEKKQWIKELERRIAIAKAKLPELAAASDEDWLSVKAAIDSTLFMRSDSES